MQANARLSNFPITWFAVVMGLAGLALAWRRAEVVLALEVPVSSYLRLFALVVFVVLAALYLLKGVRHTEAVLKELHHPVKLNFFPTISIGLILLGAAFLETAPAVSRNFTIVGASLHLLFTLYVMGAWINQTHFQIQHMNPAWFIPVVGNILVPIPAVHHFHPEISWFFFSIGIVFWLILAAIIFYRTIFHDPLPARLVPTLFILIAPPAVGFISYVALTGDVDAFARVLYYTALFLTLLLFTQARRFFRLPFFLSWWAYSFPLAAITIATFVFYQHTALRFFSSLSTKLLIVLSIILAILIVRTLIAVARKEICVEE